MLKVLAILLLACGRPYSDITCTDSGVYVMVSFAVEELNDRFKTCKDWKGYSYVDSSGVRNFYICQEWTTVP